MRLQQSKKRGQRPAAWWLSWLLGLLALSCSGEPHPEVLVLVNRESPISVAIGNAYAERRGIPARNILELSIPLTDGNLTHPDDAAISRSDYEALIRDPTARFLERTGRANEVTTLVTTLGIPLRVSGKRASVPMWLRETDAASVDAELALLFSDQDGVAGVAAMANPYYDSTQSFSDFRNSHPNSPLRYLVARLTGYPSELDPETGVPRSVLQLMEQAQKPAEPNGVWVVDEDPSRPEAAAIANAMLLRPTASRLAAMGLSVQHDETTAFTANASDIQGYVSWGSSDGQAPGPPTYGKIDGSLYPGQFNPSGHCHGSRQPQCALFRRAHCTQCFPDCRPGGRRSRWSGRAG